MRMRERSLSIVVAVALASLLVAGCGEDDSDDAPEVKPTGGAALVVDDLREADTCPLELDTAELPEGLTLGEADASVSEYDGGVEVRCEFPIDGAADGEEITASIVAATGDDLFTMESDSGGSWLNGIFNATGVDKGQLEDDAGELEGDEVETLEGNGESIAITNLEVEDGEGLLIVFGEDGRSEDDLGAIATALAPRKAAS